MFSIGEKVVYGNTGVCVIEDITEKELIKNSKKTYYVLKPVFQQNNTIYAPSDSNKVFIRPIMKKQEAEELIKRIPEIKENINNICLSDEDYRTELSAHNCDNLVKLTALLYQKKKTANAAKKKLGFSDEKYMRLAENLLFGELAAALDISIEDVPAYIKNILNQ